MEVFKVFPQDKFRRSVLRSSSLTFQFPVKVLIMDVFKIFTQDWVILPPGVG